MCRFTAYYGAQRLSLKTLLFDPENSLVKQSKACREGVTPGNSNANADGFGVAWYDRELAAEPARMRSIKPAWSNQSLYSSAHLITSRCFMGHVRAATAGSVNAYNSHPFIRQQYSFMHNGDIRHFEVIRREIALYIDEDLFLDLQGQTDSEYFFILTLHFLRREPAAASTNGMTQALSKAIAYIQKQQASKGHSCLAMLNVVFADGERVVVMRYISDPDKKPISLYYTDQLSRLSDAAEDGSGLVIASEPLTDDASYWQEIPLNSFLIIESDGQYASAPVTVPTR
ncbi:MAG: class II glutamine amidotransferase [Candidatus Dependentiae bacterium]|jgi:predicted glutamine amidotransferase